MGELILCYNLISLKSAMVWTASARYTFIFYFSLLYFIIVIIISRFHSSPPVHVYIWCFFTLDFHLSIWRMAYIEMSQRVRRHACSLGCGLFLAFDWRTNLSCLLPRWPKYCMLGSMASVQAYDILTALLRLFLKQTPFVKRDSFNSPHQSSDSDAVCGPSGWTNLPTCTGWLTILFTANSLLHSILYNSFHVPAVCDTVTAGIAKVTDLEVSSVALMGSDYTVNGHSWEAKSRIAGVTHQVVCPTGQAATQSTVSCEADGSWFNDIYCSMRVGYMMVEWILHCLSSNSWMIERYSGLIP